MTSASSASSSTSLTAERGLNETRLFDLCCAQLEKELARQTRVLDVCKEQGRAARAGDIDSLEQATRSLALLVQEGIRSEGERLALTARLASVLGTAPSEIRLSSIIARAPEPSRVRLAGVQSALKETLTATRRLIDANGRFLREGARAADRILAEVFGAAARAQAYDAEGQRPRRADGAPAVLNVAG